MTFVLSSEWPTEIDNTPEFLEPPFRDMRDPRLPSLEIFEAAMEMKTWRRSPGRPRKGSYDSFDWDMSFRAPPGRRPGHGTYRV